MNTDDLFNSIKSKQSVLIRVMLQTIETDRKLITYYEKQIKQAEQAYDLNRAAELKYRHLKQANETLVKNKTLLLKTICESAYQVINSL